MESPLSFFRMHWDDEPVGRVTPCAPQFGNAQTARRGLTRPTFRFMERDVEQMLLPLRTASPEAPGGRIA